MEWHTTPHKHTHTHILSRTNTRVSAQIEQNRREKNTWVHVLGFFFWCSIIYIHDKYVHISCQKIDEFGVRNSFGYKAQSMLSFAFIKMRMDVSMNISFGCDSSENAEIMFVVLPAAACTLIMVSAAWTQLLISLNPLKILQHWKCQSKNVNGYFMILIQSSRFLSLSACVFECILSSTMNSPTKRLQNTMLRFDHSLWCIW